MSNVEQGLPAFGGARGDQGISNDEVEIFWTPVLARLGGFTGVTTLVIFCETVSLQCSMINDQCSRQYSASTVTLPFSPVISTSSPENRGQDLPLTRTAAKGVR